MFLTIIPKPHAHPHTMEISFKTIGTKLDEELHSQEVPAVYILRVKNYNVEKVIKNNLTIVPKPHAHPHTLKKTHAKFKNAQYKTVRGVALTRHPR